MATFSIYSCLLFLLSLALFASPTTSYSSYPHLKSLHFTLFQQETINKTGYVIVKGVAGPDITQTTTPFGTIFVFRDPMTTTADPSSRVLGINEGTSVSSSLDGLRSVDFAKITLNYKKHKGYISILGGTHNTKPADHPVVGGTGDFLFVQGYVRSTPVDLVGITVTYKIDFHLYWPPYATKAST